MSQKSSAKQKRRKKKGISLPNSEQPKKPTGKPFKRIDNLAKQLKKPIEELFKRSENLTDWKIFLIQLKKVSLKPKEANTSKIKSQLIVSKALQISSFKPTLPPQDFFSKQFRQFEAKTIQSCISLPLAKLIWRNNVSSNDPLSISHDLCDNFKNKIA